jgi:hypothetical protein
MKPLTMPTLTVTVTTTTRKRFGKPTYTKQKHELEGGWSFARPVATLDALDQSALARFYSEDFGGNLAKAHAQAEQVWDEWLDANWRACVSQFVRYWMKRYVGLYGSLRGFEGSKVASYYVPGENPGRGGRRGLQRALKEMTRG